MNSSTAAALILFIVAAAACWMGLHKFLCLCVTNPTPALPFTSVCFVSHVNQMHFVAD